MQTAELELDPRSGRSEAYLKSVARAAGISFSSSAKLLPVKYALDLRSRIPIARCRVEIYEESESSSASAFSFADVHNARKVIVVGAGPAGLFAALTLIRKGLKPVVLERGYDVKKRKRDIALLQRDGLLSENSNYCFGEGGAGTFSDGKLYTRSTKKGDVGEVLRLLCAHGASELILSDSHAHIGSDRLPSIMENIRETIISNGGEYHFGVKVEDFILDGNRVRGVVDASSKFWEGEAVVLATGHSAKDIYSLFLKRNWAIEAKGFALGVRVEHPQSLINRIQYRNVDASYLDCLPPAPYSLVEQVNGKGVFSFCMCPGGLVVPASSSVDGLVLNGMSNSMRSGYWANAGVVVAVNPGPSASVTELWHWQEALEKKMFVAGGGAFKAPAQRMTDFVAGKMSANLPKSSYIRGCTSAPLHELLPGSVAGPLRKAFTLFDRKMRGYYTREALLLGVESRTSSPLRLRRKKETLQHEVLEGLYPCGEGAGYAGGIVSSAIDGINAALSIADSI